MRFRKLIVQGNARLIVGLERLRNETFLPRREGLQPFPPNQCGTACLTAALSALILFAGEACAQVPVFVETFDAGYAEGFLGGQNGWVGTGLKPTPIVIQSDGGEWGLSGCKGDHMAKRNQDLHLRPDDTLVLEATVSLPADQSFSVLFGVGQATDYDMTACFGVSQKGVMVRGATYGGGTTIAVDSSGKPADFSGQKIAVQSKWNLRTGKASVSVKNISSGETEFKPCFFNKEQTQAEASLADRSGLTTWSEIFIRIGGGSDIRVHDLRIVRPAGRL